MGSLVICTHTTFKFRLVIWQAIIIAFEMWKKIQDMETNPKHLRNTRGRAVLNSKRVDERCRIQFPVALVWQAVRCFPYFSSKFE